MSKSKTDVHQKRKLYFEKYHIKWNLRPQTFHMVVQTDISEFLILRAMYGIRICNFDYFKMYKKYQRIVILLPFLLEQIRKDYRLWHFNKDSKITVKCTDKVQYHTTLVLWRELFSLLLRTFFIQHTCQCMLQHNTNGSI